jgi:hypothetical protein
MKPSSFGTQSMKFVGGDVDMLLLLLVAVVCRHDARRPAAAHFSIEWMVAIGMD